MAPFCFTLVLVLVMLAPSSITSQITTNNISLGSSLTTASKSSWSSPSGDFAFGFQQINTSAFLLCIVFDKMPERTVVWSANRDDLVPSGSTVKLTSDGRFVLNDPSGRQVWTATPNSDGSPIRAASYAAMLDTGNFMLAFQNSSSIWQSFDFPRDTLLPTQILNRGSQLIANYSESNSSEGRFKLVMQADGNLVQGTTAYPEMRSLSHYWPDDTSQSSPGYNVVFNQSGSLYLASENGTVVRNLLQSDGESESTGELYRRVTLDHDGVLRYYVYPKNNTSSSSGGWPSKWNVLRFQPSNVCQAVRVSIGSGACGFNSYCDFENGHPKCKCPDGYIFMDASDESKGCIQNFAPQDCRLNENDAFDLVLMPNINFLDGDYESFTSYSEEMCRKACLSDCRCAIAIFGRTCWKKRLPVSNGKVEIGTPKALIKVRRSNSTSSCQSNSTSSCQYPVTKDEKDQSPLSSNKLVILGSSALVLFILLVSATTLLLISRHRQMREPKQDCLSTNLRNFSYSELEFATGGFKEVLGSGASGTVYRGVLPDQQLVAVKKLDKMLSETQDQEFITEVKVIGGTNHKNLVKLAGFCNEGQHRILVYEFMSNGSLADLLFGDHPRPNWYTRVEIAYAVARGLVYLHDGCSNQIIHCDIKPQNILLDESMTAKISDFGLAKLLLANQTRTMTRIRGTKGYVAPEWFRNMPVTAKVDVYSFGILLLELVCCRNKMELKAANEEEVMLVDWVYECYAEGKLKKLVSEDKEAMADMKKVERFVKIAMWCIQDDPSMRPAMKKVVYMLEGAVHVPPPLDPASFISSI